MVDDDDGADEGVSVQEVEVVHADDQLEAVGEVVEVDLTDDELETEDTEATDEDVDEVDETTDEDVGAATLDTAPDDTRLLTALEAGEVWLLLLAPNRLGRSFWRFSRSLAVEPETAAAASWQSKQPVW